MKDQIEQERRKSMADQEKCRKLENVIEDQKRKAEERIEEYEELLKEERRKTMMDEKRIKELERALN